MSKSVPRFVAACCLLASLTLCRPTLASEFDIVINEIHYHPFSGADDDEFVELHNRGTTTVDLSGWRFTEGIRLVLSGWRFTEGIRLVLPAGTSMPPKSYLVVSPDASHTQSRFGIDLVVGSYEGRLADGGEVIAIENRADDVISRVHFGDTHPWSSRPDGLGPSLELTDPHAQIDVPRNWAASRFVDGSPGEENSTLRVIPFRQTAEVVRDHELWRYRTGEDPYPTGWQLLGFDDGAWRSAAMGIGYGDGDDATILEDMRYRYCSIAARKSFELTEDALDDESDLVLEIRYDDGFTGWVNGVEFARANLGEAGNPIAYNERAFETSEADITKRFTIPRDFLRVGENVLAFQVHNESINSTDFSFIPKVVRRVSALPLPDQAAPSPIVINEIRARDAEVPGFVERCHSVSGVGGDGDRKRPREGGNTTAVAVPVKLRCRTTEAARTRGPAMVFTRAPSALRLRARWSPSRSWPSLPTVTPRRFRNHLLKLLTTVSAGRFFCIEWTTRLRSKTAPSTTIS